MTMEKLEQETDLKTEVETETPVADDTPRTETSPELDAFVAETEGAEVAPEVEAQPVVMTADDAKGVIAFGAVKVTQVVADLTKTNIEPNAAQIDTLAEAVHPVLLKYAASLESPPPWLAALMQYRAEGMALYAITVFGLSLRTAVAEDRKRQQREAQQKTEALADGHQQE
ncbi:hypothetical protein [Ferrimonas balearica]|uniref:hypothetical protein n=1 Tax=Ferrimonas balearica TaxID=44012 RepID=UPI001F1C5074|nr:hypothetical protein [Ferrimonas balearica]MBY6095132.1 hypothetical protein [Ferrimonas balearica]